MEAHHTQAASIAAMLQRIPLIQNSQERYDFTATATVETGPRVSFPEACAWTMTHAGATLRSLQGRVLPQLIHPEGDRALWDFEVEDDAMLFAMKFGGVVRGPICVNA